MSRRLRRGVWGAAGGWHIPLGPRKERKKEREEEREGQNGAGECFFIGNSTLRSLSLSLAV